MMHLAFALTVRGTPQLYYGEEIAMEGGEDPDNRRDFPGGFPSDSHNAFTAAGRNKDQQRIWEWTRDWIALRREQSALRRGRLIDLFSDDDVYAYARKDENETLIVVINCSKTEKKVRIAAEAIGAQDGVRMSALYGTKQETSFSNGEAQLQVPAATVALFKVN